MCTISLILLNTFASHESSEFIFLETTDASTKSNTINVYTKYFSLHLVHRLPEVMPTFSKTHCIYKFFSLTNLISITPRIVYFHRVLPNALFLQGVHCHEPFIRFGMIRIIKKVLHKLLVMCK